MITHNYEHGSVLHPLLAKTQYFGYINRSRILKLSLEMVRFSLMALVVEILRFSLMDGNG